MHAIRAPHAFDGSSFLPGGATVVLDGDRVVGVEPAAFDLPADVPVAEYDGTVLPGLVDPHVHLVSDGALGALELAGTLPQADLDAAILTSLRAQAAAGVTTVRDLGDAGYRTVAARDRRDPGMPRIVAAGPPITVPDGHCHFLGCAVAGTDDIRSAVREHHERGVDAIKVMASGGFLTTGTDMLGAQFETAELRVLVEEAHALGLPVLAHAHSVRGMEVALAAGVDGLEHASGLSEEGVMLPDDLLARVAAADVVVDPTMGNDPDVFAAMPLPPAHALQVMVRLGLDRERFVASRYRDVARMRDHGIRVVAGVDAGAAPMKRHGNAWRAVGDLVTAGYPVAEALACGTSVAAEACGLGGETGRLEPGYAADVLVVDGDVATDPAVLSRPLAVLVRGVAV